MIRKLLPALLALCLLAACKKKDNPVVTPEPQPQPADTVAFAKGADVGWITEMEAAGRRFYDAAGTQREGMSLLKSLGMNTIRLRVWVNPSAGYNNKADVIAKAVRAKALGMRVMIDFHYSDTWADPGNQTKPAAWAGLDLAGLKGALAAHTVDVLSGLSSAGVTPEWVQVGNETSDGMLWPEGRASTNMAGYAQLEAAGYDAVKSVFPNAKVIVHLHNAYDNSLYRWHFDGLKAAGGKWDVIGMSLYPAGNWRVLDGQALSNMNDMVSRYNKDVMLVEVGMPWDDAEAGAFLSDIIAKTRSVANRRGLGVLYWEPLASPSWQGYTLGAFDNNGRPTAALNAFQ